MLARIETRLSAAAAVLQSPVSSTHSHCQRSSGESRNFIRSWRLTDHEQAYKTERKPFRYNSGKNGSGYESRKSQAWREASDIRERLRDWEAENHDTARTLLEDQPFSEKLGNFLTRSQTARTYAEDTSLKTPTADLFDGDILTDLRAQTSALQPGDLVETRYDALSCLFGTSPSNMLQIRRQQHSHPRRLPGSPSWQSMVLHEHRRGPGLQ